MSFLKYQHVERVETAETEGLFDGECFIFPKLDGTNGSVWYHPEKGLQAGSRNRLLTLEHDNAGFYKYVSEHPDLIELFRRFPSLRLYGEWLVPHTLKSYRDDAWKKFWIFDVFHEDRHVPYKEYQSLLGEHNLDYIPPLVKINNPRLDDLFPCLEKNTFLIKDGAGIGEGIVIKRYDFVNRYGRTVWGKLITTTFKENHIRHMGCPEINGLLTEEIIVRDFLTDEFIKKEQAKIVNRYNEGCAFEIGIERWSSKMIPELLGRVWHEFIKEEITDILRKMKNPKIDFRTLNRLVIQRTKEVIGI